MKSVRLLFISFVNRCMVHLYVENNQEYCMEPELYSKKNIVDAMGVWLQ